MCSKIAMKTHTNQLFTMLENLKLTEENKNVSGELYKKILSRDSKKKTSIKIITATVKFER